MEEADGQTGGQTNLCVGRLRLQKYMIYKITDLHSKPRKIKINSFMQWIKVGRICVLWNFLFTFNKPLPYLTFSDRLPFLTTMFLPFPSTKPLFDFHTPTVIMLFML